MSEFTKQEEILAEDGIYLNVSNIDMFAQIREFPKDNAIKFYFSTQGEKNLFAKIRANDNQCIMINALISAQISLTQNAIVNMSILNGYFSQITVDSSPLISDL